MSDIKSVNIGAMFEKTSKSGNQYYSLKLFNSDVSVSAFPKIAKSGTKYYELVIFKPDTFKQLEKLIEGITKIIDSEDKTKDLDKEFDNITI